MRNLHEADTEPRTVKSPENKNKHFFQLAFGKRPAEELYRMDDDPGCLKNLAQDPAFAKVKSRLWKQLKSELKKQGDPRILGDGDIFDFYPYCNVKRQQKLYNRPDWNPVKIFEKKYGKPTKP